jgi:hypothetical protein
MLQHRFGYIIFRVDIIQNLMCDAMPAWRSADKAIWSAG